MALGSRGPGVHIVLEPPLEFILRQHGRFRAALLNLGPLWDKFEKTMEAVETERFTTEGYGEWPGLSEATLRGRSREGLTGPIMVRTGELRRSLIDPASASQKSPMSMSWGTDVPYAHFHQDGGSTPGRPPQRELLSIRVEDRRRLERDQVTFINEAAALTFGRI